MKGKPYPPEEIERGLQALAVSGGNASAASRATGIPRTTLIGWKGEHFDEFDDLRQEKKLALIEVVWNAARTAITALELKFPAMAGKDLAITTGILIDKGLLLGGDPSQIIKVEEADARTRLLAALTGDLAQPHSDGED